MVIKKRLFSDCLLILLKNKENKNLVMLDDDVLIYRWEEDESKDFINVILFT